MKIKQLIIFLSFILTLSMGVTHAQLTESNPTNIVVRGGNRASEGDFGVYFGTTTERLQMAFDKNVKFNIMPLINVKYMLTDQLEMRMGIDLNKKRETENGTFEIEDFTGTGEDITSTGVRDATRKYTNLEVENRIYPGIAYHFSKHNLLDVYVGGELPIGYSRTKLEEVEDDVTSKATRTSFHVGLGAFIGLQAYIANLPIAVGVEYGISSIFDTGQKDRFEYRVGENDPQISYKSNITGKEYDDLKKARRGEVGNQFRITLTYYFK